jgi:MFS family permease
MQPQFFCTNRKSVALQGQLATDVEIFSPVLFVPRYVGRSFDASPRQLGFITLACALVQAVCSPIGGLLGHYFDRVKVLSAGCFLWATMATGFALCNSVSTGATFWAFNGVGLALLIPNAQSLIADYYKPVSRGAAFGALYLTAALGGTFGALLATNLGHLRPFGIEGWRFAFFGVAMLSAAVGVLNLLGSVDPRIRADVPEYAQDPDIMKQQPIKASSIFADVGSVLAVPSFIIVVVQGIVG